MITDIHTHLLQNRSNAVVSGSPEDVELWLDMYPDALFSAGIHPWLTEGMDAAGVDKAMGQLAHVAANPRVVAVGECGLDGLRGGDATMQLRLLREHVMLSESLRKPLVLHVVKGADRLLALRKEMLPELTQPWIWHGFRGKPQLAQAFMAMSAPQAQAFVSFGERFNPSTVAAIPLRQILVETDESRLPVAEIIARVATAHAVDAASLICCVEDNVTRLFSGSGTAWATSR